MSTMRKKAGRKIQVDFNDNLQFKIKTKDGTDQRTLKFGKDEGAQQPKLKKRGKELSVSISTGLPKDTDTAPPQVSKPIGGGGGRGGGGRGRGVKQGGGQQGGGQQGGGQQGGGQQGGGQPQPIKVVQPQQPKQPQPPQVQQPKQQQPKAKAMYTYAGQTQDELSFNEGDILTIHKKDPGGWWEGELNGKRGWVPANYLEEM